MGEYHLFTFVWIFVKRKMTRSALFIQPTAFLFLAITKSLQSDYQIQSDKNKALFGFTISETTVSGIGQCLQLCLANCSCESFQICHSTECQLCSSNKYSHPAAMEDNKHCSTFNFVKESQTEVSSKQCKKTCASPPINCCLTSNPCLHGGTCVPALVSNSMRRYSCKCPKHYGGDRCETLDCLPGYYGKSCEKHRRICMDVASNDTALTPTPGIYTLLDHNLKPFKVLCDFDGDTSWTLVQSYALYNNGKFLWTSFLEDAPMNKDNPNWHLFRLGRPRMNSIKTKSTKWRVTCCYDTMGGVDYQDYVKGSTAEIDLLDFHGKKCIEVDYISVRGQNCSQCTAYAFQKSAIFHFQPHKAKCEFKTSSYETCPNATNVLKKFESNFGFYGCANEHHLCSSHSNATTQTWFGAQLPELGP